MISTRLTEKLSITHPVISAPMAFASGGRLAAAVSDAGGLGLIGGGYGDGAWIEREFKEAGNQTVGCGFITWALKKDPAILDLALAHAPKAIFLSFDDPKPFAQKITDAGSLLICQVQTMRDMKHAVDCGAEIIVSQGSEAGGHGIGTEGGRGTFTLVPEIAEWLANNAPEVLLCAAGGIGDGRGLAASLMLGADGALVGSRFWASRESLAHGNMVKAAINSDGDGTIRSSVMDIAREIDWPQRYTARVLKNAFTEEWHNDPSGLIAAGKAEADKWRAAWAEGNTEIANTFVGEVTGILRDVPSAAQILEDMVRDASRLITGHATKTVKQER